MKRVLASPAFAFGLILIAILANAVISYRNLRQVRDHERRVTRTHEVQAGLADVVATLTDAETGERGFILTGKNAHLEGFDQARQHLSERIARLRELVADNPSQLTRLQDIEVQSARRVAILQEGIDVRTKAGLEAAREFVLTGSGTEAMDAIRADAAEFNAEEDRLLAVRAANAEGSYNAAVAGVILAAILALGVVGLGYFLIGEELKARRCAEAEAHKQREWCQTCLASIGDAVIITDAKGRIDFMNGVAQTLTGWKAEGIGKDLPEVFHIVNEQSRQIVENPVAKVLRNGTAVGLANHTVLITKDGRDVPIDDSGAPIRDTRGGIIGVALIFRDVTERRHAEDALRESHRFLISSLDALTAHIAVLDENGNILMVNEAWRHFAHTNGSPTHEHGPGTNYLAVCERGGHASVSDGGTEATQGVRDVLAGRAPHFEMEYPCHSPDEKRWFSMRVTRFESVDGPRAVVAHFDITSRRLAEEALRDADRRKDEFLAILAHELRNPLAPLRNALHLMRLGGPDSGETVREARALMERQVEHLVRLVDDLLDVSRFQRGKIQLHKRRIDLADVVARAVESSRPLIDERRHGFTVAIPDGPLPIDADAVRLAQVVLNLLNNAAKYTPEGGRISLTVEKDTAEAVIHVRDNGSGIPAEMLPRIFDAFTQIDHTLERAQGGLGIGLSLVKRLTEKHGGTVEAFSDGLGKGSEFVVRVPLAVEATPALSLTGDAEPNIQRPIPTTKRQILVVDDSCDSGESLAVLLRLLGNEVRTAANGPNALEQVKDFCPDIVLLDIGLPGMSGFEVCRRLRSNPSIGNLLIVALTGFGTDEDRRQALAAGFDAHLVKPVDLGALQSLLGRAGLA